MKDRKVILVPVSNLVPGMVAARDVYTRNDQLLIAKNSVITENLITRITFFGIMSVSVYVDETLTKRAEEEDLDMSSLSLQERVRLVRFKKNYDVTIKSMQSNMNQLLTADKQINTHSLIDMVDKLVFMSGSRYQIFDVVHNIKSFDDETYRHSLNVAMINNVFAGWLGMSEQEKNLLTLCGLLHDVGKLLVDKEILKKPARLTEAEYEEIKQHPMRGYQNIKDKSVPESVKRTILLHHERCDGKGYPFGVRTGEIDPYAAITSIADVYEAMTATRVYRKGMSPFKVIKILEEDGKKQFNMVFLVPILNNLTNTYLQHDVVLSNGKVGKIVLINKNELSRPMVMVEHNQFIDLAKERDIDIVEVR